MRVSAVEVTGKEERLKDLLAHVATSKSQSRVKSQESLKNCEGKVIRKSHKNYTGKVIRKSHKNCEGKVTGKVKKIVSVESQEKSQKW